MTTIVDLDTGQVSSVIDGRDYKGVGGWLFKRPFALVVEMDLYRRRSAGP
jgi:hypothetical protein